MNFFNIFRKKNKTTMNKYAIEIAKEVDKRIKSFEVAKQFILEELEAASQGNNTAKKFVENSGISNIEYANAMKNSFDEVDGADGPQEFLVMACMQLNNIDLMVETRLQVVNFIMKKWNLGKYSSKINLNTEIQLNYISTIVITMGVEFDETENINDVKTKSIDFTKKILKINGKEVPHFKLYENTLDKRSWLAGEEGEIYSMLISVEPKNKQVQFTVFIPTIEEDGGIKPSIQTFNYDTEIELKYFPI